MPGEILVGADRLVLHQLIEPDVGCLNALIENVETSGSHGALLWEVISICIGARAELPAERRQPRCPPWARGLLRRERSAAGLVPRGVGDFARTNAVNTGQFEVYDTLGKPPLARPELTGQAEGGGFLPQSKDPREESGPVRGGALFWGRTVAGKAQSNFVARPRKPCARVPDCVRGGWASPRLSAAGPSLRAYRIKHDGPALGPMGDIVWTTCNDPPPNGHPPSPTDGNITMSPTDGNITIMPRGLISSLATSRISSTCSASNAPNAPAKVAIASAGSSRNTAARQT